MGAAAGAIINAIFSLVGSAVKTTAPIVIAFIILIWFTLSIIYAITQIINLLLGQPLIGWFITGNINSTNSLNLIFQNGVFNLTGPLAIFIYIGLGTAVFLWLPYFIFSVMPFNFNNLGTIRSRWIGMSLILTSIVWMPVLYFLFILISGGLLMAFNSFFNIRSSQTAINSLDLALLKNNLMENLSKLKNIKNNLIFNQVNINSEEFTNFVNSTFNISTSTIFISFVDYWNESVSDKFLSINVIDNWISTINSINLSQLDKISLDQKEVLNQLLKFSNNLNSLSGQFEAFSKSLINSSDVANMNKLLFTLKENSTINLETFNLKTEFLDLNNLTPNHQIDEFAYSILNNNNFFTNDFSQRLVDILYSLILSRDTRFTPGWGNGDVKTAFDLFWLIPNEFKIPVANMTAFLFYNIKSLAIGGLVNSILLPALLVFSFLLLKRFAILAYWPIVMLISLAKTGQGSLDNSLDSIKQFFYKFISIIIFAVLWNLITFLIVALFDVINKANIFENQTWIFEVFKVFILIGILIGSFAIVKELLEKLEQDRSLINTGAEEIAAGKAKLSSQGQSLRNTTSKLGRDINKKWTADVNKNPNGLANFRADVGKKISSISQNMFKGSKNGNKK